MNPTILIIEDEPSIADNISYALQSEGFTSNWVNLGVDGLNELKGSSDHYGLVILDIGLPDLSGFEVCKKIREFSDLPIIFLSARGAEIDKVVGLEIGGDDYVVKPFSPRELVARVKLRLKKGQSLTQQSIGKRVIELDRQKHNVCFFGIDIQMTSHEFGIIEVLCERPGTVFSREQLMQRVWSEPQERFDRVIDTHIKTIRSKLKSVDTTFDPIVTHRGLGYSLRDHK